jgi:hypothetical protein
VEAGLGQRGLGNLEGLWELNFSKPFYLWKIARRSVGLIKEQLEKVNARLLGVVLNGERKATINAIIIIASTMKKKVQRECYKS